MDRCEEDWYASDNNLRGTDWNRHLGEVKYLYWSIILKMVLQWDIYENVGWIHVA
jgi:hypothetical protein